MISEILFINCYDGKQLEYIITGQKATFSWILKNLFSFQIYADIIVK